MADLKSDLLALLRDDAEVRTAIRDLLASQLAQAVCEEALPRLLNAPSRIRAAMIRLKREAGKPSTQPNRLEAGRTPEPQSHPGSGT